MLNLSSKFKQDRTQQADTIEMNIQPIDCGSIWEHIWIKLRFQTKKMVNFQYATNCNQLKQICHHKLRTKLMSQKVTNGLCIFGAIFPIILKEIKESFPKLLLRVSKTKTFKTKPLKWLQILLQPILLVNQLGQYINERNIQEKRSKLRPIMCR